MHLPQLYCLTQVQIHIIRSQPGHCVVSTRILIALLLLVLQMLFFQKTTVFQLLSLALAVAVCSADPALGSRTVSQGKSEVVVSEQLLEFLGPSQFDLSACPVGTKQVSNKAGNRTCLTCKAGFYSATSGSSNCVKYRDCPAGKYISLQGTLSRDRVCLTCAAGTYSLVKNSDRCLPLICQPGNFFSDTSAQCEKCPQGQYSATQHPKGCKKWSVCAAGMVEHLPGSSISDRVCTLEVPVRMLCPAGFVFRPPSCSPCPSGHYSTSKSLSCRRYTECELNEYIAVRGTNSSDRVCQQCKTNGHVSPGHDSFGEASCTLSSVLRLKPTIKLEYLAVLLLSALVWRWTTALNRRPPYKKSRALIAYEKAAGLSEGEVQKGKKGDHASKTKKVQKGKKQPSGEQDDSDERRLISL